MEEKSRYSQRVEDALNKLRQSDERACKAIVYLFDGEEDKSPGHISDLAIDAIGWLVVVQTASCLDEGIKI
jgi:hypothetical protein